MSIFDKLLTVKQLAFSDGEIVLMGQRALIIPQEILISLTKSMVQDEKLIPKIYEDIRTSFHKEWATSVRNKYGFEPRNYIHWLIDTATASGWGKNKLVDFDSYNHSGTFHIENAPMGKFFRSKTDKPVEHFCRALYAGGATAVFEEDIDWVETKCVTQGAKECELVFGPRKYMLENYKEFKYQILEK